LLKGQQAIQINAYTSVGRPLRIHQEMPTCLWDGYKLNLKQFEHCAKGWEEVRKVVRKVTVLKLN
jgi:hypothetical protein